jgi:hypothetical protein
MLIAVLADIGFHPDGKGVYDGYADSVQTAGNLVRTLVEFASGMKARKNELQGAYSFPGMDSNGNSASVVLDANNIVLFEDDQNPVAMTGHGLVDGVVDDFIYEMM